jgi:hypothetical protein
MMLQFYVGGKKVNKTAAQLEGSRLSCLLNKERGLVHNWFNRCVALSQRPHTHAQLSQDNKVTMMINVNKNSIILLITKLGQ